MSDLSSPALIMIIDDDKSSIMALELMCEELGHQYESFESSLMALDKIKKPKQLPYSLIICDYQMPELNGLEFIEEVRSKCSDVPLILITAHGTSKIAVNALELGAFDYITKPVNFKELSILVNRAITQKKLKDEYAELQSKVKILENFDHGFIGRSKVIENINQMIRKVSKTDANILITGETGTGKEVIAKAIHQSSLRKDQAMVTINCASIPENLLESELFGHKKGAFTGADKDKDGLFLEANNSTLFLDEIGDMSISLQAKLLRVIQEGKVRKVGENKEQNINVRLIAATHKNLIELIKQNLFREDLFFRLNVINIHIPPLRERSEDIILLTKFFLKKFETIHKSSVRNISKEALNQLMSYSWPGNVRELENVIERAIIVSDKKIISEEDIQLTNLNNSKNFKMKSFEQLPSLDDLEKDYILYVLRQTENIREKAIEILKINRKTLYRKIKDYKLEV